MILDAIFGEEYRTRTIQGHHPSSPIFQGLWGGKTETASGEVIDESIAMKLSAVFAAVRLISWTRAVLPLCVYERKADDKLERKDHDVYDVVHNRPNPDQTPMAFYAQQGADELLWGKSCAWIEKTGGGQVGALWPLSAWGVRLDRGPGRKLYYDIQGLPDPPTSKKVLRADEVLHVPNVVGSDRGAKLPGIEGRSVISYARQQLGEATAAQKFGAGFFAGGALYAFALKTHKKLGVDAKKNLREGLAKVHGYKRRIPLLDEGMEIEQFGMPLADAQFLESRKFHISEIARWFGVPPHKLRDLDRATFSNIEEQKMEWYEDLLPLLAFTAQEYTHKLFPGVERGRLYVEHIVESLLRGDMMARYQGYSYALKDGWMNRDEIRRRENLNSMGEAGKVFTINPGVANLADLDKAIESSQDSPPAGPVTDAAKRALDESVRRVVRREAGEARKAAQQPDRFLDWLERQYARHDRLPAKFHAGLSPAIETCRAVGCEVDPSTPTNRHLGDSRERLLEVSGRATAATLAAAVDAEVADWEETRATALLAQLLHEEQGNGKT